MVRRAATVVLLLCIGLLVAYSAAVFRAQSIPEILHPSPSLTHVTRLSDYNSSLLGTPGDTEIYVFEGAVSGGTALIVGGTHATEIAGVVTAALLVETLDVQSGRVLVIPRANASAATHTTPGQAHPTDIEIETPTGSRRFRFGSRYSNPVHHGRDPYLFRHAASPVVRRGREARNLNRVYPGVQDGTLTERVAWAIVELIRAEHVDIAFDLHEAPPDRRLVHAIVASEASMDIAAEAAISLQLDGWDFHLESSAGEFRGLSHREWTDATDTRPILMETSSPVQGRLRGRTTAASARTGQDSRYEDAARRGLLAIPFDGTGSPLETRVARNLAGIHEIILAYNSGAGSSRILFDGVPAPVRLRDEGIGAFLASPGYRSENGAPKP